MRWVKAAKDFISAVVSVPEIMTPLYWRAAAGVSVGTIVPLHNGLIWANDAQAAETVV